MKRLPAAAFALLVLAALGQAAWQHDRLPERVASHFNPSGVANGWMPRGTQTAWHVGTILFMAGLMEGLARLNACLPDALINLPHRDHWLAPERRAATRARLTAMIRACGAALMLFFLGLFHLLYLANVRTTRMHPGLTALLTGGLLLAVALITGATLVRFYRPRP